MSRLLQAIKQAGVDAIEASQPVVMLLGRVTQIAPLEVTVDQRFTLTAEFLIVPESMTRYEIDVQHTHTVEGFEVEPALVDKLLIRRGLENGDTLILLRLQGGSQYLILDRAVLA